MSHTVVLPMSVFLNRPLSSAFRLYAPWFRNKQCLGTFIADACTSYQATCTKVGRRLDKTCACTREAGPLFFIVKLLVFVTICPPQDRYCQYEPVAVSEPPTSAGSFSLQLGQVSLQSPPQVGCRDNLSPPLNSLLCRVRINSQLKAEPR